MKGAAYYLIGPDGKAGRAEGLPVDAISTGSGVFETMLVIRGRIVFADAHLARLKVSCKTLTIAAERDVDSIYEAALRTAAAHAREPMRLRLAVFGERGGACAGLAAIRPASPPAASISLRTAPGRRHADDPLVRLKTVNYLANLRARADAADAGYDEALFLDDAGGVAETSTANVFAVLDGRIVTPPLAAVLPGIVRAWVLATAPSLALEAAEAPLAPESMAASAGVFVTNSIIGLVPVSRIDDKAVRLPSPAGPFGALAAAYARAVAESGA